MHDAPIRRGALFCIDVTRTDSHHHASANWSVKRDFSKTQTQILHRELSQCTPWLRMTSNYIQLVYGLQNGFLPKRPAVKHLLNCGDLRDWVKNAAVVPAQAENSGWPFMSFASWSLTSSGIFRLPELLFSKHQKVDIKKNSDFNFIQHNHSFVFCFFFFVVLNKTNILNHVQSYTNIRLNASLITERKQKKKSWYVCSHVTGCFLNLYELLITGDKPGGTDVRRGCLLFQRWRD